MDDEVHQGSSILLNFVLMYVHMAFIILVRGIYSVTKSCNTHTHGYTKSHIEVWNPPGTPPKKIRILLSFRISTSNRNNKKLFFM